MKTLDFINLWTMDEIVKKLDELARASAALEPGPKERHKHLRQVEAFVNSFLATTETEKAFVKGHPRPGIFALTNQPKKLTELLEIYESEVSRIGINAASGGHVGYIPGGGIYLSALADYLADVTNEFAGMYFASPGAVTIENEMLNWLKSIFGFPKSAVGNLTSGGSIANLIALTAARDHHGVKSAAIPNSVIYTSPQVHHCIQKSLRIIGLEDVQIRYLELDKNYKINPDSLSIEIEKDKAAGLNPFLVIASAGTTDTGAIDPLQSIAMIAKDHGLWFHVDAAYGGFFILVPEKKQLLQELNWQIQ